MRIQDFLIRRSQLQRLVLAVVALTIAIPAGAQDAKITLPGRTQTTEQVFEAIRTQTPYKLTANMSRLGHGRSVQIDRSPVAVSYVLDRLLEGSGYTYAMEGNQIILPIAAGRTAEAAPAKPALPSRAVSTPVTPQPAAPVQAVEAQPEPAAATPVEEAQPSAGTPETTAYLPEPVVETGMDDAMATIKQLQRNMLKSDDPMKSLEELQQAMQHINRQVGQRIQRIHQPEPSAQLPKGPIFALKTNLLYDATTTFNLGAEFRLSKRLTLDASVNYNPWTFSNNKKFKHVLVQPELRYWIYEPFNGHFLGPNLMWSIYNVGGIGIPSGMRDALVQGGEVNRYRYEGNLYGIGAAYGYHWMLSNVISLEATIGFGYAYLDYTKFNCETCGLEIGRDSRHYFGLTKLGLSLVFMIK